MRKKNSNVLVAKEIFYSMEHPEKVASFPASSLMYVRGDLKEAEAGFYNRYRNDEVFYPSNQIFPYTPDLGMVGKTGVMLDQFKYDPEYNSNDVLYLAHQARVNKTPFVSITGEISTDQQQCLFKVNTERTQAVTGRAKDMVVSFDDVDIKMFNEHATIYLNSLSYDPIWKADRLLLTTVGRKWNSGQKVSIDGSTFVEEGTTPILIEPIEGEITLKTKDDVKVYALTSSGERKISVDVTKTEDGYSRFYIGGKYETMHYEILKTENANSPRKPNPKVSLGSLEIKDIFTDVDKNGSDKKKIERMYMQGFINGTSQNTFSPETLITRRDFTSMLIKAFKLKGNTDKGFNDVTDKDNAYKELIAAKSLGIINGDNENNFRPDEPITWQDMMVLSAKALVLTYKINKLSENKDLYDASSEIAEYAKASVQTIKELGYIDDNVKPLNTVSRSQATAFVYDLLWK